jgi:hypothetical protein
VSAIVRETTRRRGKVLPHRKWEHARSKQCETSVRSTSSSTRSISRIGDVGMTPSSKPALMRRE